MQSKTAFNTICIFTQSTRQSEAAIFPPHRSADQPAPQKLMHEAFIKVLFIAIDVFNGENTKSFYDFSNSIFYNCRNVILDFQSHSLAALPGARGGCHTWECVFWSENRARSERAKTRAQLPSQPKTATTKTYSTSNIYMPYH
jgi:hypothetical protein